MRSWSVRAKLLAFAAIVMVPVLAAAYLTAQNSIATTRAQVLSSSAATANVASASVDDFLSTAERLLRIVSQTAAVQSNDRAGVNGLFADILSLSPEYLSLYMLDDAGKLEARLPNEPATANDMRYGGDAMHTGQTSISGRLGTPERLTAALAVPVNAGGKIDGALGVEFALDRLQRTIADSVMKEHAVVLVFDGSGRVLVAPETRYYSDSYNWMSVPLVQAALHGEQGAAEYRNPIDGATWLGAYAPVRRAQWAVLVSYPSEDVFAPVRAATMTAGLMLIAVVGLTGALAVGLAARFTRPVLLVKDAALSFAQGDYARRVPVDALPNDEIGQLALAFNQMAESLQQHMAALMDAQREIEQKAMDLQQLLDRSVTVQEGERKRIAQEIHDGITQTLVGAIYEMQAAKQALATANAPAVATQKLSAALTLVSETVSDIRRVIFDLHPTLLDELGLVPALQRLVRGAESESLRCTLQVEGAPSRLSSSQELALYRIAQESLTNIQRHAHARHARLALRFEPGQTVLVVSDDGRGLQAANAAGNGHAQAGAQQHLGLIGMKERAQSVGGHFALMTDDDGGTSIRVTLPRVGAAEPDRG